MSKKNAARKPPLSKARVRRRMEAARTDLGLVRVTRWIEGADRIEGFVVGLDRRWVVLARLSDGIELDGWVTLRIEDILSVTRYPTEDCFEIKALQARAQWPPVAPGETSPADLAAVIATGSAEGRLVSLFREFERPQVCWIGAVRDSSAGVIELLEVNTDGGWARKTRRFDPDDVTRVDFGGRYEQALSLVARTPPRAVRRRPAS